MGPNSTTTSSSPPGPSTSTPPNNKSSPAGFIAGGVVGGIALILAIICAILYWRRRAIRAAARNPRRSSILGSPTGSIHHELRDPSPVTFYQAVPHADSSGPSLEKDPSSFFNNPSTTTRATPSIPTGPSSLSAPVAPTTSDSRHDRSLSNEMDAGQMRDLEGGVTTPARDGLTTRELVGMLNDRLRRGSVVSVWGEDESPPIYGGSELGE